MSRSEQYDHVLSEEFDDYEDRRRCPSFYSKLRHRSRARCPPERSTLTKADVCLILLMVVLMAGILWLIYDPGYDINMNGGKASKKNAKTATAKESVALGQAVNFEALRKNLPKKRRHKNK
ncbi:hypothetical protein QTP88_013514 [Uroleucon formosanum]